MAVRPEDREGLGRDGAGSLYPVDARGSQVDHVQDLLEPRPDLLPGRAVEVGVEAEVSAWAYPEPDQPSSSICWIAW